MNIADLKHRMIWCCACSKMGKTLGSLYSHQKSGLHLIPKLSLGEQK